VEAPPKLLDPTDPTFQDDDEEEMTYQEVDDINNNPLEQQLSADSKLTQDAKVLPKKPITKISSRKRVILKNGNLNLCPKHVEKRHRRYLHDLFTTMVDIRWRWNLAVFTAGFLISWFGFAMVWWLIALLHSDIDPLDSSWTPCVQNLNSFTSAILFSIETQHTIGKRDRTWVTSSVNGLSFGEIFTEDVLLSKGFSVF